MLSKLLDALCILSGVVACASAFGVWSATRKYPFPCPETDTTEKLIAAATFAGGVLLISFGAIK